MVQRYGDFCVVSVRHQTLRVLMYPQVTLPKSFWVGILGRNYLDNRALGGLMPHTGYLLLSTKVVYPFKI